MLYIFDHDLMPDIFKSRIKTALIKLDLVNNILFYLTRGQHDKLDYL